MDLVLYPSLANAVRRYASLVGEPLQLTAIMTPGGATPLAGYDPVNLDNLLARCVVEEATDGAGLPPLAGDQAYVLPVPLFCLWCSPEGLPLWAATPFVPLGASVQDVEYLHKRAQTGEFTRLEGRQKRVTVDPRKGRMMERRTPMPTQIASAWTATVIGDPHEVARLLTRIAAIGKKRAAGFGTIDSWLVEPLERFELVHADRLTRNLPLAARSLLSGQEPDGSPAPLGWTLPQWRPDLFALGWWRGTPVGLSHSPVGEEEALDFCVESRSRYG